MKKINKLSKISACLAVFIICMFFATGVRAGVSCWLNEPNPAPADIRGVAYGNGVYVAVGYQGTAMASSDGENWSPANTGTVYDIWDVIFADNKFVAVGSTQGALCITSSTDGQTWTYHPIYAGAQSIAYGNGTFVSVGRWGNAYSTDAETWHAYSTYLDLQSVTFGNGIFVAVGYNISSGNPVINYSTNGSSWSAASIPPATSSSSYFTDVTYGGGNFIAIGTNGRICTSSDAVNWTDRQSGNACYLQGVAYGNGNYLIVPLQYWGAPVFYTSQDTINWTPIYPIAVGGFWRVKYLNDSFIAVGASSVGGGMILKSCSFNADLGNLQLSSGILYPTFSPATINYTSSVDNYVSGLTVIPTVEDSSATVTVNGNPVDSGVPSGWISLAVGSNVISVGVTAQDGTTRTYTVDVLRRAASSNADLSDLTLSSGTLNPAFTPSQTSYTASVENSISSVTVMPTVQDNYATVTVNNNPVQSGSNSSPIDLAVGANSIVVVVTAQNGTQKTYTATITRAGSGVVTIDAENYDSMYGVSIEDCSDTGGGKDVYGIHTDDWMNYVINIPVSGYYTISYRVSNSTTPACIIELREGSNKLANTAVPANKVGWITLATNPIYFTAGEHTLQLYAKKGNGFKLNWIKLTQQ